MRSSSLRNVVGFYCQLLRKKQLSVEEVLVSRKLSRVRIHVERAIRRDKCFRILQKVLPIAFIKKKGDSDFATIDKALVVCCVLTNLQPRLVRDSGN